MSAIGEMNQNVWTRKIAQRNDDGKRRSKRLSKYSRYFQARLLTQRVLDYQIGQRILWGADYSLSHLWSGKVLLKPEQKIAKNFWAFHQEFSIKREPRGMWRYVISWSFSETSPKRRSTSSSNHFGFWSSETPNRFSNAVERFSLRSVFLRL